MLSLDKVQPLTKDFDYEGALPNWQVNSENQELVRVFVFKDFKSAFQFMTLCANFAEKLDHHPDWTHSGGKVAVRLSTHSVKALTELDITMAHAMDQFACQVLES